MRERDHARVGANELPVGSLRKDIAGTAEKQAENEESGSHCFNVLVVFGRFGRTSQG
jgi:hypothetical protein